MRFIFNSPMMTLTLILNKSVTNSVKIHTAMEYDFVRAGLLLIVAGMLLGLGARIVIPKKPEGK